ncbi:asparagine synthase [Stappia sp. 22II-S9-Z10]|nr:asparagine synthase [Stappia sp. 22II-S9-Z10]
MIHRGPDGADAFLSVDRRIGLGHRRLSIIDLSERASQPMASVDGRQIVVFNGEIYNFPELRRELEGEGVSFRTTSDTEILLHLYRRDGPGFVARLRGMFAFALWDEMRQGLLLARDPYGIKPLYVADDGWTLRFASEVKALVAGGAIPTDPEPAGVVGFYLWGSIPEPFTLYRAVRTLPAGNFQWVDAAGPRPPVAYASVTGAFVAGAAHAAAPEAIGRLVREAALDSVRAHLLADVEVGLFLSAGIDSSALLGLMRDAGQDRIRAVTLAFAEFRGSAEDEAPLAAEVAAHYGAEHVVRVVDEAEFRTDLPTILASMDQPSIDGVNTYFIAKAAREAGLKVALSGLGADEILAGYPSFEDLPRWVRTFAAPSRLPGAGRGLRALGTLFGLFRTRPKALGMVEYGGRWEGAYLLRRGLFMPFELTTILEPDLVREGLRRLRPLEQLSASLAPSAPLSRVAALESEHYLRNQLLRDSDWAGMAHSLEIRTPFVDMALLEALAPVTAALSGRAGKIALAAAPSRPLPDAIAERAKTGFGVPIGAWLTRSLGEVPQRKGAASRAWARRVVAERTAAQPLNGVAA